MVNLGLSRVSQSLTHSRGGIMWLEPAAGAIPEAQWFLSFSLGSQCASLCSPAQCGPCWGPEGFVNGRFLSEKGVGHFQKHGGDTLCWSTLMLVLLPWSAVLHTPPGEALGRCSCPLWFKKPPDHRVATHRAATNASLRCTGLISCSQVPQMISLCTACVKQLPITASGLPTG